MIHDIYININICFYLCIMIFLYFTYIYIYIYVFMYVLFGSNTLKMLFEHTEHILQPEHVVRRTVAPCSNTQNRRRHAAPALQ